jgi:hypothetical protein
MYPNSILRKGFLNIIIILSLASFLFLSCQSTKEKEKPSAIREKIKPDTLSMLLKYENSLFPLPSPYQAAFLIKKHDIPFDENFLNSTENKQRYNTTFKKALNLGIYGSNLSYLNIYERTPQSINYLSVLKKLSDELNLSPAFSADFFNVVERNIGQKDSLLVQLSKTYRKADGYLRESDRTEIGALILTGGWVESLYVLTQIAKITSNREIINRIGEQKHPLDNLIELLTPFYYKSTEYSTLIDQFIELAYEFDGIIYSYSYKPPKIDVEKKIMHINSESRVIMSEYHLDAISKKIEQIRTMIIE